MSDWENIAVKADNGEHALRVMNALMPQLPAGVREKLIHIELKYHRLHGFEGLYDRVNNKTIAQILSEFDWDNDPKPIESGQIGDVQYKLYAPPDK